jgi:hypothetical protein
VNALETALYEKLAGMALAGVTHVGYHPAPQGTACPHVTFNKQAGAPAARTFGNRIAFKPYVYVVRVIDQGNSRKHAGDLLELIDAQLDGAALNVTGYGTMLCRREGDLDYEEAVGGELYHHVGGLYRVQLTPSS